MSNRPTPPQDHKFREGNPLFGKISPDKISLRVHSSLLNLDQVKVYQVKGPVTITNAGGAYWDIGFHAEVFVPWMPELPQIGTYLFSLWSNGILAGRLGYLFIPLVLPVWSWDDLSMVYFWTEGLKKEGILLVEAEISFDLPCPTRPIQLINRESGHKFRSTLYSNDGIRKTRSVLVHGEWRKHSKGYRKDLVAEYNRGKKTNSQEPLWRIELRLSRFHLQRFSWWDFLVPFYLRLIIRFDDLVQLLKAAIPAGSWSIRSEAMPHDLWYLRALLTAAGWRIR